MIIYFWLLVLNSSIAVTDYRKIQLSNTKAYVIISFYSLNNCYYTLLLDYYILRGIFMFHWVVAVKHDLLQRKILSIILNCKSVDKHHFLLSVNIFESSINSCFSGRGSMIISISSKSDMNLMYQEQVGEMFW